LQAFGPRNEGRDQLDRGDLSSTQKAHQFSGRAEKDRIIRHVGLG
jgi:hypothetical protein